MSKLVKDLPKEIQDLWVERAKEDGNSGYFDKYTIVANGFFFINTKEGFMFWYEINKGNYEPFYKLYPKK